MIVSHKHKFIFIKTHKTAGTSFQIALSKHCGDKDIISRLHPDDYEMLVQNGGKKEQNIIVPKSRYNARDWFQYLLRGREQVFTEHNAVSYLKRWLTKDVWTTYYKFGFERHPYEKVLSYYYWRTRENPMSLEAFLDTNLDSLSDFNMYSQEGNIEIDKLYKYEKLTGAIKDLEDRFGFIIDMNNVRAKSTHRPQKEDTKILLSSAHKEAIDRAFESEFRHFYTTK